MIINNPYNCVRSKIFVGYGEMRGEILSDFQNGRSFAIVGGRRIGKTSILQQLEKDVNNEEIPGYNSIYRYFSLQEFGLLTTKTLFQEIFQLITKDLEDVLWTAEESPNIYQEFRRQLEIITPKLEDYYGTRWLVILAIDETDRAIEELPDRTFFHNIRHLLTDFTYCDHFRLVVAGVTSLTEITLGAASPLNILSKRYLRILLETEADQLIYAKNGFSPSIAPYLKSLIYDLTGRHPYLLQWLLEKLWRNKNALSTGEIEKTGREFVRERDDFKHWVKTFGSMEKDVYSCLADNGRGPLDVDEIYHELKSRKPNSKKINKGRVEEALNKLSYHGVIDEEDLRYPRVSGSIFQQWFRDTYPYPEKDPNKNPQTITKLFCSYSHNDKKSRARLEVELQQLRLDGLIKSWCDQRIDPGDSWDKEIKRNLEDAGIILFLISPDFLASEYCRDVEMSRALELHKEGKAKVIPVIIRPSNWKELPLGRLQALPTGGNPVSVWENEDEAWLNVNQGIRKIIKELRDSR